MNDWRKHLVIYEINTWVWLKPAFRSHMLQYDDEATLKGRRFIPEAY